MIEAVTKLSIERHIKILDRLRSDSERVFGTLDACGMIRHLRYSYEMSTGKQEAANESKPVIRTLLWIFAFNILTEWPGGQDQGTGLCDTDPGRRLRRGKETTGAGHAGIRRQTR